MQADHSRPAGVWNIYSVVLCGKFADSECNNFVIYVCLFFIKGMHKFELPDFKSFFKKYIFAI